MDRDLSNVRDCTECAHYSTCKTVYGWLGCNPKSKEKEDTESETGA